MWSVVDGDAPYGPVPAAPAGTKVRPPKPLRDLDVRCSHEDVPVPFALVEPLFLRDADKARAVIVTESDVTVWFDGAVLAAEPIAIAARVVAQLATDAVLPEGPYR
ncbi:MAG: hypothetical protein H0T42_14765 [Deltaproteobacteria bacterium]|nr:hypothetical protein [Deltaproteobacteria bacterium]